MRAPLALLSAVFLIALPACSTTGKAAKGAGKMAVKGTVAAASVPFEDLNLKREKIPKTLKRVDRVYPEVPPDSCFMIDFEIRELTRVLGPDEDDTVPEDTTTFRSRMTDKAGEMSVDAIKDAAASQIPFRDMVRRASGAKRHERLVGEAYDRGAARRTYLKGLGDAMGCTDARVKRELYEDEKKRKKVLGLF